MKYCDIGLNLFCRPFPDPEKIIRNAQAHEVGCILTGSDDEENRQVTAFVSEHPGVYGTCGLHPHGADAMTESALAFVRASQTHPSIVAVGECGLDYDRMFSTRENQRRCLERHMQIALETGKPMFLHERSAFHDLCEMFRPYPELCANAVVHCFTGDRSQLMTYLDMGFMIGITGWICDDRRAGDLRDAVSALPLDRVMLETDAPYLTPKNVKGLDRINVPENIRYVAHDAAFYMHVAEETLIERALENTIAFFHLSMDEPVQEVSK